MTVLSADFARKLRKFGDSIEEAAHRMAQNGARAALISAVRDTPGKSGLERGNWQVSLDAPATGTVSSPDPSGAATIQRGLSEVEKSRPGQSIHITNNLPEVARLNDGSSGEAPKGFIERARQVAEAAVRKTNTNGPSY